MGRAAEVGRLRCHKAALNACRTSKCQPSDFLAKVCHVILPETGLRILFSQVVVCTGGEGVCSTIEINPSSKRVNGFTDPSFTVETKQRFSEM